MQKLILLALACCCTTGAMAQSFDFETTAPGNYVGGLSVSNGGQTLTITPEGFPGGTVSVDFTGVGFLGSLAVIANQGPIQTIGGYAPMRMTFATPVSVVAFRFGDGGGDDDSPVAVYAYDSLNALVGTYNDTYPFSFSAGKSGILSYAPGIKSLLMTSTPSFNPDSLFWEISDSRMVSVGAVPEPFTMGLAALGLGVALKRRRR